MAGHIILLHLWALALTYTSESMPIQCSRIIWLGDLNYRVSLSYEETKTLLEENEWDILLEKDQVSTTPYETGFFRYMLQCYYREMQ